MSSLKIKIPPKASTEQPTKSTSRKANKRRITSDDEDDDSEYAVSPAAGSSLSKPPLKKARLSNTEDFDSEQDSPPPRAQQKAVSAKPGASTTGYPKSTISSKKKTRILSEDDDDDFVPELEEKPAVAVKPKMKDPKGKTKAGPSGGSGNMKITAKSEARPAVSPTPGSAGKKRLREEEDLQVDVTSVPTPTAARTPSTSIPNYDDLPPRKKLPTIKKKSKTDSAASSAFVSPAPGVPPPKPTANPVKPSAGAGTPKPQPPAGAGLPKKPQMPVQATTTNPSGTGDFDLRDSNTWQSLMGKGTSSSGPRVGVEKRVSTEERRKQLDKMRDEARAVREEQARDTFDLQAQSRKIAAFEKRLANVHDLKISGPHILGAAFKARPIPRTSQPVRYPY